MSNPMYTGYQTPMYQPYPQRMQSMQQSPTIQQPMQGYMQQTPPIAQSVLTLVTSKEQAIVAQIPFDGQTYYFANTATDEVYSKRFDINTGTAPLIEYQRRDRIQERAFAPLEMVQQMAQQLQAMQEHLQAIQPKAKRTASKEEESA